MPHTNKKEVQSFSQVAWRWQSELIAALEIAVLWQYFACLNLQLGSLSGSEEVLDQCKHFGMELWCSQELQWSPGAAKPNRAKGCSFQRSSCWCKIPMRSCSGICQCLVVLTCGLLFRARWWDDGCLCPSQPGGDGAPKSPCLGLLQVAMGKVRCLCSC